jgi:DNA polymerase III subunit delta
MPALTSHELLSRLKKGEPVPAILLLGAEPYLRDICRAQLIEQYVAEAARTWAVSRFSAERGDIEAALDQAQTLPMLSPQQVVFLENTEAIEEFADKKREDAVELLESYLADPAPFTVLVLEAAQLDQRMKLYKLLVEKSLVVTVGLGDDPNQRNAAAVAVARSLAKEQGVEFEKGAAEDLAECVSADLQRLKTEIEKLATFAGERKTILLEDVASMVISERTTTVWEMADMIASRQGKRALDFLDRLLRSGEEPIFLLGGLLFMYRKLVEASEVKGVVNGWQAARALQMAPEKAELAVRNARKISKPRLLAGMRAFQLADNRLKGGSEDPRAVMEFLIAELTAPETRWPRSENSV